MDAAPPSDTDDPVALARAIKSWGRALGFQQVGIARTEYLEQHVGPAVVIDGERVFWKIDAYDADMVAGPEDAADPELTDYLVLFSSIVVNWDNKNI